MVLSEVARRLVERVREKFELNERLRGKYVVIDDWSREEDGWIYLVVVPRPELGIRAVDTIEDMEAVEREVGEEENVNLMLLPTTDDR